MIPHNLPPISIYLQLKGWALWGPAAWSRLGSALPRPCPHSAQVPPTRPRPRPLLWLRGLCLGDGEGALRAPRTGDKGSKGWHSSAWLTEGTELPASRALT